jgi:hypothetical protein
MGRQALWVAAKSHHMGISESVHTFCGRNQQIQVRQQYVNQEPIFNAWAEVYVTCKSRGTESTTLSTVTRVTFQQHAWFPWGSSDHSLKQDTRPCNDIISICACGSIRLAPSEMKHSCCIHRILSRAEQISARNETYLCRRLRTLFLDFKEEFLSSSLRLWTR